MFSVRHHYAVSSLAILCGLARPAWSADGFDRVSDQLEGYFAQNAFVLLALANRDTFRHDASLTESQAIRLGAYYMGVKREMGAIIRSALEKHKVSGRVEHLPPPAAVIAKRDAAYDELRAVLDPKQLRRLKQICLQQIGPRLFATDCIRQELELDSFQVKKVDELFRGADKQLADFAASRKRAPSKVKHTNHQARIEIRNELMLSLTSLLTERQHQILDVILGPPLDDSVGDQLTVSVAPPARKTAEEEPVSGDNVNVSVD